MERGAASRSSHPFSDEVSSPLWRTYIAEFRKRRMAEIIWTDYMKYRAQLRSFELATIEQIVSFSSERYFDTATQRMVAVGRHAGQLVIIPYEHEGDTVTPVSIHSTTRQQINLRLQTGRFEA
jgi:hypothetical protein